VKRSLTLFAILTFLASTLSAQVKSVDEIKAPPLRKFSNPQPKRIALANGMVIFLQEDHELPLIKGSALIRGGSRDVPADKAGLVGIYTQAWRTGGTASRTGDQLDEFLDARAARVETGGGTDSTSVSLDVLKQDFDAVFPIFTEILRKPELRQDKIDLAKTQANTSISRRNDDPGSIMGRELQKLGYGADSPYARQTEYATIASITRDDLLAFHKRTVHPNNIILAFIGDFDTASMEKKLRDAFASWAKGPQITRPANAMNIAKPGIYFVAKDDVTQANIAMIHAGIERSNPDYFALQVMNEIFGGGFSGRLMQSLRSAKGLTYGVGGGVGSNWDYPGLFRMQMATKSGTTLESITALKEEAAKLAGTPVTEKEMSLAKESILNAFVFTMDTREKALNQQVSLEFYGFPKDYYVKYPSMIEKVTAEDVQRVAKTYVHPDQLVVLVVGNEKDFEKPLSSLGAVTPIDITIPEAGGAKKTAAAASTGSNAEGTALVNKVADFVGGKAAIDQVQSMRRVGAMTVNSPQGEMEIQLNAITSYANSSQRAVMGLPMGEMTRVITPAAAFMITPMGTQDIPSSQRDTILSEMRADLINVIRNIGNAKYTFTSLPGEKVNGVDALVLQVNADGSNAKWYVEPSGRLMRTVTAASAPMPPGDVITDFSEWKAFSGINLPTVAVVTNNGQKVAELKLSNVELNPAVDEKTFVKP
jgi:zinc protease